MRIAPPDPCASPVTDSPGRAVPLTERSGARRSYATTRWTTSRRESLLLEEALQRASVRAYAHATRGRRSDDPSHAAGAEAAAGAALLAADVALERSDRSPNAAASQPGTLTGEECAGRRAGGPAHAARAGGPRRPRGRRRRGGRRRRRGVRGDRVVLPGQRRRDAGPGAAASSFRPLATPLPMPSPPHPPHAVMPVSPARASGDPPRPSPYLAG